MWKQVADAYLTLLEQSMMTALDHFELYGLLCLSGFGVLVGII